MKDLEQCRTEIDSITKQMIELFEQRMQLSKQVVEYKLAHDKEIFQPDREKKLLEKNLKYLNDQSLESYAKSFIQDIMNISKSYQSSFIPLENLYTMKAPQRENITVGYQGVEGAFSHQVLKEYFGEVESRNYQYFEDVFKALKKGEIRYGVLPLENSSTGAVNDNYDLVRDYDCYIVGEYSLPVSQHLLAVSGTKIEDIKEVYSHPQALQQSSKFIDSYPEMVAREYSNTAAAAKYISELKDNSRAAIGSKVAAELYGLEVLQESIHNDTSNHTRFIIISNELEDTPDTNCVSIVFTLPHKPGSLFSILQTIKDHQINLSRIESRPMNNRNWEYYFYIDFEESLHNIAVQAAIEQMKTYCLTLRVIGNSAQA